RATARGGEAANQEAPLRPGPGEAMTLSASAPGEKYRPRIASPQPAAHEANGSPRSGGAGEQCNGSHDANRLSPPNRALWMVPAPPANMRLESAKEMDAWRSASIFCALWPEAIVRMNRLELCEPTGADKKTAFQFFRDRA